MRGVGSVTIKNLFYGTLNQYEFKSYRLKENYDIRLHCNSARFARFFAIFLRERLTKHLNFPLI
jgi:hypothetical protein